MGLVHSFEWTLVFRLGSSSCESSCELGFMRFRVSGVTLSSSCESLVWFGGSYNDGFRHSGGSTW